MWPSLLNIGILSTALSIFYNFNGQLCMLYHSCCLCQTRSLNLRLRKNVIFCSKIPFLCFCGRLSAGICVCALILFLLFISAISVYLVGTTPVPLFGFRFRLNHLIFFLFDKPKSLLTLLIYFRPIFGKPSENSFGQQAFPDCRRLLKHCNCCLPYFFFLTLSLFLLILLI